MRGGQEPVLLQHGEQLVGVAGVADRVQLAGPMQAGGGQNGQGRVKTQQVEHVPHGAERKFRIT